MLYHIQRVHKYFFAIKTKLHILNDITENVYGRYGEDSLKKIVFNTKPGYSYL